jgi:dihydroflavonol-4-reductase
MPSTLLITGASGQIGSHVLLRFCMEGIRVRAMVRNQTSALEIIRKTFEIYGNQAELWLSNVELIEGDLLNQGDIDRALVGVKEVIHCAGLVSFNQQDCKQLELINTRATADLVNEALEKNVSWFCHISSVAAFGKSDAPIVDESIFWKNSPGASCYAVSKYGAEREVWRAQEEGLSCVVFCPGVVTGASVRSAGLSSVFSWLRRKPRWFISGSTGYVDVRDVADAVWFAFTQKISGEKYILNAENLRHKDFLKLCAEAIGHEGPNRELSSGWVAMIGLAGSLFQWLGISTRIPDRHKLRVISGFKSFSNDKFIQRSGIRYRNIRDSVRMMASVAGEASSSKDYKPGW